MTPEEEGEEDVDSGWDLGSSSGPASAPPTPPAGTPALTDAAIDALDALDASKEPAKEAKGRIGAATRPNAAPVPSLAAKPDKLARPAPAMRTSIGLRKPAVGALDTKPADAPASPADDAPPTVGRPMPPPRSRSNTPRVTNAVQKARAMDEALATSPPTAGALPKSPARTAGMRIPASPPVDRSNTPQISAMPDVKAPATALRFGDRAPSADAPSMPHHGLPGGRKQTLRLNRATQDFAVKMLTGDAERAERSRHPSGPALDLHLPLELSLDEPLESVQFGRGTRAVLPPPGDDAPDISLDDDVNVSVGESAELAPDELAAVDELDDVLDGLVDSLPGAALQAQNARGTTRDDRSTAKTPIPSAAPTPIPPRPPSLGDLELSLEMDEPKSREQPPSLTPSTTRGFQEDDPVLAPIRDRIAKGDFVGALMRAEALLQNEPDNVGATYFVTMCQEKIRDLYIARLGSGEGIPHVQLAPDAIVALALDHRSGFLISLIDGIASIDDVLDMSGMPPIEALRLLLELKNEGVIGID